MNNTVIELKEGIKLHAIKTDKYKTDFTCVIITTPLRRDMVTKNALVPFLLKRGTQNFNDQYLINRELENLYGATFNCGIDRNGDNVILKFCMETISNEYALNGENILKQNINLLLDIVFNPIRNDGKLNNEFLETEINNLRDVINSKIDDKDAYAYERCINVMYGEEKFGLYKYGYEEDLKDITIDNITEYYDWLINNAKIDIFVSGNNEVENVKKLFLENDCINKLESRKEDYIINGYLAKKEESKEKEYIEEMDVTQGKLILGLDINDCQNENYHAIALVYNAILGDGANSMMFQNVREKASLCYTAKSILVKQKANIFIKCGIQIENYEKALSLIKVQIENIKNGEFSENDVQDAKTYLISSIKAIEEEQDTEIVYYLGQELSKTNYTIDEYIKNVEKVSKQDIVNLAKNISINTVYFLKK